MSRGAGLLALVAAILMAAPATAAAADLCVGMGADCPSGADTATSIDSAIPLLDPGETLYLGSGPFTVSAPIEDAGVEIVGSGPANTTITGTRSRLLELSGDQTLVRDLAIQVSEPGQTGLFSRGDVDNVLVTAPTPLAAMTGIEFGPGTTTLRDSGVLFGARETVPTVGVRNTGSTLTIEDSNIEAARGIDLTGTAGKTTAGRVEVTAPQGVWIEQGDLFLGSSILRTDSASPGGDVSYGLLAEEREGFGVVEASNVSIVGTADYAVRAMSHPKPMAPNEPMLLADSIYLGPGFMTSAVSVQREPLGDPVWAYYDAKLRNFGVPQSYDDVPPETWLEQPGAQVLEAFTRRIPAADVLDEREDLRPPVGSPLIDAGAGGDAPAWAMPGDFLEYLRRADGDADGVAVRDIGAHEHQPLAVTATRSKAAVVVGEAVTFSASATDETGDAPAYAWSFDDGGTASGKVVSKSFASAGTRIAVVTVTDSTGRKGTASVSVTVVPPATTTSLDPLPVPDPDPAPVPAPAPPTAGPPPGGTTAPSTGGAPRVIRTLAVGSLRSLRVRRGRVAVPVDCRPACKLRLVLESRGRTPATLGSVSERVAKAGARTLNVKLTAAGARLLRRRARTVVTATLSTAGLAPKRRTATVLRA